MVFNSAEAQTADSGYTSFLSRLGNRTASSVPSRPLPPKTTNNASSSASKPPAPVSAAPRQLAPTNPTPTFRPNGASASVAKANTNGVKRKIEERPNKIQETGKPTPTSTTKPGATTAEPAKAPKKGSYMELLQRAKTGPKVSAGAIVNKPKAPVEPMKKEWQKKIQEERAAKAATGSRASKSPGVGSGGEKVGVKAGDKGGAVTKKPGAEATGSLKRGAPGPLNRKTVAAVPAAASSSKAKGGVADPSARTSAIRERDRSPPARKGPRDDYPQRGGRASVYDRPKIYQRRYTYRDDTDSDSDMEATGIDILEEEEISAKRARLEDLEQERLEKKLAADKAAKKRAMLGRK